MQHSKAARRAIHKIHKGHNMWRLLAYTEYARGSVLRRQGMSIVKIRPRPSRVRCAPPVGGCLSGAW
jgi:hypothetical protein